MSEPKISEVKQGDTVFFRCGGHAEISAARKIGLSQVQIVFKQDPFKFYYFDDEHQRDSNSPFDIVRVESI